MTGVVPFRNLFFAMAVCCFLHVVGFSVTSAIVISFLIFLWMGGILFFKLLFRTLPRDLRWLRIGISMALDLLHVKRQKLYISDGFQATAAKYPNKVAIVFENRKITFKELDEISNKIANMLHSSTNLKHRDTVAIFMENCPEFVFVSLALSKIGVAAALINCNLTGDSLAHCIRIANCSGVFFHSTLSEAVAEVLPNLAISDMLYCVCGESSIPQAKSLEAEISTASPANPPPLEGKSALDTWAYMYSSGTTGLPKCCVFSHIVPWAFKHVMEILPEDRIFAVLPLYHLGCGAVALSHMYCIGSTIVLGRRFSAKDFFPDLVKYKCMVFFYIGEQCRYILAQPKRAIDNQHCVRLMIGNAMSAQVWSEFVKRFQIPKVIESYSSTDSSCGLVNLSNKVGACGFISLLFPFFNQVHFVKIDPETEEYVRDSRGFCVEAGVNEPGEAFGKIGSILDFGYKPREDKVMTDVFIRGDRFFMTGDILRRDEDGFVYFCDRKADRYRWRGETVSTTGVEAIMSGLLQLRDVVVYGVEVPGNEGRAGMAAIVGTSESVDMSELAQQLFNSLPHPAVPLFIRLIPSADLTGTFKLKKVKLRNEGFDISLPDPLYVLDPASKNYVPLSEEIHQRIQNEDYFVY